MKYLDEYLDTDHVRRAIERCVESPAVQGVIVDLDEWWLSAWRWKERHPGAADEFMPAPWRRWDAFRGWDNSTTEREPVDHLRAADLKWKPRWWDDYCEMRYGRGEVSPGRLRVCLLPRLGDKEEDTPGKLPDFSELKVNHVYEPHPVPRLAANPTTKLHPLIGGGGIGVGTSGPGTLGGLLRDAGGRHYGVTCAHVVALHAAVDHPAQTDVVGPNRIGSVVHARAPMAFPPSMPLTPANQAAHANDVDAALVEIDRVVASRLEVDSLGPIASVFPGGSIQQWQSTTFAGRTSGVRTLEFRGKIVYYNIPNASLTGTMCFRNLYEVQWLPSQGFPGSPPVQAGDSGAWLCVAGTGGYEWAAMVVAWDPTIGFAVAASEIEVWWKGQGLTLHTI